MTLTERALLYIVKRDTGLKIYAPEYWSNPRGQIKWQAKIVDDTAYVACTASIKTCVKYGLAAQVEEPNAIHPDCYLLKVKPVPAKYKKKKRTSWGQTNDNDTEI